MDAVPLPQCDDYVTYPKKMRSQMNCRCTASTDYLMDENVTAAVPRPDVITAEVQKMRAHPLCPEKIPSHRPGQDLHAIAQAGARRDKYFGWVSDDLEVWHQM
ncbi:MAG: hypothetical protein AB4352_12735 [Hormoscilla sp.]